MKNKVSIRRIFAFSLVFVFTLSLNCHTAEVRITPERLTLEKSAFDIAPEPSQRHSAAISIKESRVVREIDRKMFGVSFEWGNYMNRALFRNERSLDFSQAYLDLADKISPSSVTLARAAGSSSHDFLWKSALGPLSSRKSIPNRPGYANKGFGLEEPQQCGVVEFVKSIQLINPEAEFIFTFNFYEETAEDNADLVRFLTLMPDDPKAVGKDGTNWAQVRIDNGLEKPVKVVAWELGNEVDKRGDMTLFNWYISRALETVHAVREVDPEAKFIGCATTTVHAFPLESMEWRNWNRALFTSELMPYIDYITRHTYYDGVTIAEFEKYMDIIKADELEMTGKNRLKFAMTEHSKWPTAGNAAQGGSDLLSNAPALEGCLSTADFFNRMFTRDDVWCANYHTFNIGAEFWKWFENIEGEFLLTGIPLVYDIYTSNVGDRVVESTVTSDSEYAQYNKSKCFFTVLATASGDRTLNIMLVNKKISDVTFDLTFDFENNFTLVKETVFTAPNMQSKVYTKNSADIFSISVTEKNQKNFKEYNMPAKSFVVLTLESDKPFYKSGESETDEFTAPAVSDSIRFPDIRTHWAANEINSLAELGIVNGSDNGMFKPDSRINRAEFIVMLTKALNLPEIAVNKNVFNDVSPDDWFNGAIHSAYANGLIRGAEDDMLKPYDSVTLEQLAVMAVRAYRAQINAESIYNPDDYLTSFLYMDKISPWAKEPIAFAVKSGILSRLYENGMFDAQEAATRAQAAVVIYRLRRLLK